VEQDGNDPMEFVAIYNDKDYTISNANGRYAFTSTSDSLTFYRIGYQKLKTTFGQLQDTIYLIKSPYELDEVVVTNAKTLWDKVRDSLPKNYNLVPYKEKFLLRGILKYNNKITRIQDMQGKLKRKTLLYSKNIALEKKDYEVELTNMRKVGIVRDEHDVYFRFPSFFSVFSEFIRINATGDDFILTENYIENRNKVEVKFASNATIKNTKDTGHYIINASNNAIESFTMRSESDFPYTISGKSHYRTVLQEKTVLFTKGLKSEKYFISFAKSKVRVEQTDTDRTYTSYYDIELILMTSEPFGDFNVKSNVNEQKDIFKIDFPYDQSYWNSENQLLLTDEMQNFIKKVGDENTEFKIKSNLK